MNGTAAMLLMAKNPCPVCQNPRSDFVKELMGHQLVRCRSCYLVFSAQLNHPSENTESVGGDGSIKTDAAFSDGMISDHGARTSVARTKVDARIKGYERCLGRTPTSILEIGCGDAAWAPAFAEKNVTYQGVESDLRMAEFCRKRGYPVVSASFGEYVPSGKFDVVFASQVLEHVVRPSEFVARAHSSLADGGILHLDLPNHRGLASLLWRGLSHPRRFGAIEPPHHLMAYSPNTLRKLLERSGFQVLVATGVRNDRADFGQLYGRPRMLARVAYLIGGLTGLGGLLMVIGRKKAA